jgi:hypothetical protein
MLKRKDCIGMLVLVRYLPFSINIDNGLHNLLRVSKSEINISLFCYKRPTFV